MTLHCLLYRSLTALDGEPAAVEAAIRGIVERSRAANEAAGITGALLVVSGVFLQALEGPLDAVERVFERICRDMRHRRVEIIDFLAVDERAFAEWPMAAVAPRGEFARLCASLDGVRGAGVDPSSASATIQLMRAMAAAGDAETAPG